MFQTITKLYEMLATPVAKGKYIYFGASVIYCDENNKCMVYYNPEDNKELNPVSSVSSVSSASSASAASAASLSSSVSLANTNMFVSSSY